jgi:hypothetical protein
MKMEKTNSIECLKAFIFKKHYKLTIALLYLLNLALAFPGMLTADSYMQLEQARSLVINNHHPALMSIVWHYLDLIYEGPFLMLVFSLGMLWLSVGMLYSIYHSRFPIASKLLIFMPFTPAIISNSSIIWKDVLFGNAFFLAIAISLYCFYNKASIRKKHVIFTLSLVLIWFGAGLKFQAQFIAPFVICLCGYLIYQLSYKKIVLLGTISILFFALSPIAIRYYYNVENTRSEQLRQFFDIAGISVCSGEDLFPEYIKREKRYSFDKIVEHYDPEYVNPYVSPTFGGSVIYSPTKKGVELDALEYAFYNAIIQHPICYFFHRALVFRQLAKAKATDFTNYSAFTLPTDSVKESEYNNSIFVEYINPYVKTFVLFSRNIVFIAFAIALIVLLKIKLNKSKVRESKEELKVFITISIICLLFCMIMFFTSMASDNRYLYIVRLLISMLAPIMIGLLMENKKVRN